MFRQLIHALILVGTLAPGVLALDLVWEPTELVIGVPTTVSIYIQANDSEFFYGAGEFRLAVWGGDGTPTPTAIPDGGLFYDTNGLDDTNFTADDGWAWQGSLTGSGFIRSITFPSVTWAREGDSPFRVPPNDRLLAATLEITGTELGDFRLVPRGYHLDHFFDDVTIKEGAEPVFHVTPTPPTAALLAAGALAASRRRRR